MVAYHLHTLNLKLVWGVKSIDSGVFTTDMLPKTASKVRTIAYADYALERGQETLC